MKIVLFGYGKMGQIIEKFAQKRGHEIHLIVNSENRNLITVDELVGADVAIDFGIPQAAMSNMELCLQANLPIVMGTTGWYEHLDTIKEKCLSMDGSILYGSNFSIGVNIFFHINKILAKAIQPYKAYDVQVEEIHHIHKLDAPSGTAITIAEGILNNSDTKTSWVNSVVGDGEEEVIPKGDQLLIESHRIEEVPGTHTVVYSSEVDQIEFKHTAHSRDGFALGSVIAAEWLFGKQGFYQVTEMFDFNR